MAYKGLVLLLVLSFSFPTPLLATKTKQGPDEVPLHAIPLLDADKTPKQVEAADIKKAQNDKLLRDCGIECAKGTAVCCYVTGFGLAFLYGMYVILQPTHIPPSPPTPTMAPDPCAHLCWYLKEFPNLPQDGYYYTCPRGCRWFVNCTENLTTTLTTIMNMTSEMMTTEGAQNTTTSIAPAPTPTTYYKGEVGFEGEYKNHTVCKKIPAPTTTVPMTTTLNTTTMVLMNETTANDVQDSFDDCPPLVN